MAEKNPLFDNGKFYHTANFGIDKKIIFNDKKDIDRFLALISYYKIKNPPARFAFRNRPIARENTETPIPMIEIIAYSLMPDHFHLLIKQTEINGVNTFLSKLINSYTKYFNNRQKRSGTLFKGSFKAVEVPEERLNEVTRHIHLEPVIKGLVLNIDRYPFSSYLEYIDEKIDICKTSIILNKFTDINHFKMFTQDKNNHLHFLQDNKKIVLD